MPNDFNKAKDKVLTTIKAHGEREGFKIEVMSYDGNEPKIALTRYYKNEDGAWVKDPTKKYPRFSVRLVHFLIEKSGQLDAALSTWEKERKNAPAKTETKPDGDPF